MAHLDAEKGGWRKALTRGRVMVVKHRKLSAWMPVEMVEGLERLAQKQGVPVAAVMRFACGEVLSRSGEEPHQQEQSPEEPEGDKGSST